MSTVDNVSEIYSLYSHPVTSRAGSASRQSDYPPTPLGEQTAPQNTKPTLVGPRSKPANNIRDSVQVYPLSAHDPPYRDGVQNAFSTPPEFRSPQECGPEPYEEYFSIPIPKEFSGPDDMRRRRSTKELIQRFESMSADNPPKAWPPHGTQGALVSTNLNRADIGLFTPPFRAEKKTSPLRQSFRNLLSVFKKGKLYGKEKMEAYGVSKESKPSLPNKKLPSIPPAAEHEPDPFTINSGTLGSRICTSPTYSLQTGALLHLSPPTTASSPILPVWIPCDAVLHRSHILLTSATTQGIPRTDVVSLRACTDVKSLAPGEIGIEQRAMLPAMENSTNPRVFELIYDGKEKQLFAAPTVKDRAAWVSAVWDAILQNQDKQLLGRTKTEIRRSLRIDTKALPSQLALSSAPVPDPSSKQPEVSTMETESAVSPSREPSPHSKDASSMRPGNTSTPSSLAGNQFPSGEQFSAGITTSQGNRVGTREEDLGPGPLPNIGPLASSSKRTSHSQPHSPSIVNLGRSSVVRKRLAEIQRSSTSSTSTPRNARQSPPHTVSKLTSHERLAANAEADPKLADSGSLFDAVGLPVSSGTEQPTSPVSSGVSPLGYSEDRLTSPASATSDPSTLSSRPKSAFRLREEMRARDSVLLQHRRAYGRSPSSAAASPISFQADETAGALLDVMDVHAERQLIKTAELSDQIQVVQADVRGVAANIRTAISGREEDSRQLAEIQTAVDDVRIVLAHLDARQGDSKPPVTTIDEGDQAQIFQALEEIQAMLKSDAQSSTVDSGAKTVPETVEQPSASFPDGQSSGMERPDLADILQKLDMLVALSVHKPDSVSSDPQLGPRRDAPLRGEQVARREVGRDPQPSGSTMHNLKGDAENTEMRNLDNALPHDDGIRAQLIEQQAESVRYLNELNTWLETFVNGGTAQIAAIAEDVQKLCTALGNMDELQEGGGAEGNAETSGDRTATFTLLQGVRRLAEDSKRRDRDSVHLVSTMNGLVAALNEDMRKNAEMRNAYTTESVLGVIERQRQDQERMLRTLANELSDDIRGERLRFVEAMKEATAINVQIHVEEFKKELTREVLISTQEVGRLQRERQLLEQQIADLFAFYSKQKQTVLGSTSTQPPTQPLQPRKPGQEQNRQPSRGRTLPLPPPDQRQRS